MIDKLSEKRLKSLFFPFVLVQGIFYLFLIPPWQSPDESHHFGYRALFSKDIKPRSSSPENIEKKIIESMDIFHAWKYQNVHHPNPLPHRLEDVPFYGESGGLSKVPHRAPLYYLFSSFLIEGFKIDGIVNQLYLIRSFSLTLFLLSIYFTYLSARILFKDNYFYCLAAVSFVAFLPQALIISTSVSPINLAVLLETIVIYLILLSLNKGKKQLALLLSPVIIGLGFFNHAAAVFMIPPFITLILIYFIESIKNRRALRKIILSFLITTVLFLAVFLTAYHLFPSLSNSSMKIRLSEINKFIKYFFTPTSVSSSDFFNGFFLSFWYLSGWMRFRYLLDIYSILKIISLLSFFGLSRYLYLTLSKKKNNPFMNFKSFLILSAACLSILFGIFIRYISVEVAQGRFVFPAISAFALLFVLGLREVSPKKLEKSLPIFIIIGFVLLDIYTIFNHLIRAFYYFTNA